MHFTTKAKTRIDLFNANTNEKCIYNSTLPYRFPTSYCSMFLPMNGISLHSLVTYSIKSFSRFNLNLPIFYVYLFCNVYSSSLRELVYVACFP